MGVREGSITTSAMNDIIKASKTITIDVLEDGGAKMEAITFIKKLMLKGVRQVK